MVTTPLSGVASWLATPPKAATQVGLYAAPLGSDEPVRVLPRTELGISMVDAAENICSILQDDCDQRRERTRYSLRWLDEHGTVLASRSVELRPVNPVTGDLIEAQQTESTNPMAAVLGEVLRWGGKNHQAGNHLQATLLARYEALVHELIEDKKFLTRELIDALKGRGPAEASGDATALDEAKALAFERAANTASEHLIPAIADLARQHGQRMLQAPKAAAAKPKTNGRRKMSSKGAN